MRRKLSVIALLLLVAAVPNNARQDTSQPPAPTSRPDAQDQQTLTNGEPNAADGVNQQPEPDVPGPTQPPANGNGADGNEQGEEGESSASDQSDRAESGQLLWTILASVVSAFAAATSAVFAFLIWRVYRGQLETMNQQARYMREGIDETRKAADAAKKSADTIALAERAYIAISCNPPGLTIEVGTRASFKIHVKNVGRTPARITDVAMCAMALQRDQPLPEIPPRGVRSGDAHKRSPRAFLVAGDEFSYSDTLPITVNDTPPYSFGVDGTHLVYLIGYVDYIDSHGVRHRVGHARVHVPALDNTSSYKVEGRVNYEAFRRRNNLSFVTARDYNYDRKRKHGEGHDWDEGQG